MGLGRFSVSCSICLESVTGHGDRSCVKLQCGHEFHLDCIGSAFNAKGMMQCPNCRNIEKGQWLCANGYRPSPSRSSTSSAWASVSGYSMVHRTYDEDLYNQSYSERPSTVQWCPSCGKAQCSLPESFRFPLPFESIEPLSSANRTALIFSYAHLNLMCQCFDPHPIPPIPERLIDEHSRPWYNDSVSETSISSTSLRSSRFDTDGLSRAGSFVDPFVPSHGSKWPEGVASLAALTTVR